MTEGALAELRAFSAGWGGDAGLVQGAGGNTSFKSGDRMMVKASGMRLADALHREIFVEVSRTSGSATSAAGATGGLRPSIETSLHALLPHPFVAHVHAVEVLAFAVRDDGEAALSLRLDGLRWGWLPYVKPGAALAEAVAGLLERERLDILVLGNHGLVVGGESCAEIDSRLTDIRRRLATHPRGSGPDVEQLSSMAARFELEPARYPDAHLGATDPQSLAYAMAGTLYPDHVVFLGRGAVRLGDDGPAPDAPSLLFLAPGVGALLPRGAPNEAHEMAACLGAVSARIASGARVRTLSAEQETELLQWDAETYRQSLAKTLASTPPAR